MTANIGPRIVARGVDRGATSPGEEQRESEIHQCYIDCVARDTFATCM